MDSEEQEEGVGKDIFSVEQLKEVIDKAREKRMEDQRLPRLDPEDSPVITLMAGYRDNSTTVVEYYALPNADDHGPRLGKRRKGEN